MSFEKQIMHDVHLMNEIASFCDFDTLLKARQICRALNAILDQALDSRVKQKLPLLYSDCPSDGESNKTTELRRGWSAGYRSRQALFETAMERCPQEDPFGLSPFDEDRARYLLRRNNNINAFKFDAFNFEPADETDEGTGSEGLDQGWTVKIIFRDDVSKNFAKQLIIKNTGERNCKVRCAALWLLVKGTAVKFAKVKCDSHDSDDPECSADWRLMMQSPSLGQVELKCHSDFQAFD